ncbi:unnamed protein product, partial [Symbiodinium necroappetens]
MEDLPAFRVPDDVIEALSATADGLKARADVLLEKLSDITHDKHLPGTSWKENLSAKATVAEIQLAAGVHLDNDVSGLPALLSELIEAEYAGAVHNAFVSWHKKIKFLTPRNDDDPSGPSRLTKVFSQLAASTGDQIHYGYVFKSEGMLANGIVEPDKD